MLGHPRGLAYYTLPPEEGERAAVPPVGMINKVFLWRYRDLSTLWSPDFACPPGRGGTVSPFRALRVAASGGRKVFRTLQRLHSVPYSERLTDGTAPSGV